MGESLLAVVPRMLACGDSLRTSLFSAAECLRLLSMNVWLFTFRVMQLDVSQEGNALRET